MTIFRKLARIEREADEFGFMWNHYSQILDQIRSEVQEIEHDLKQNNHRDHHLQEEIGDLIHAAFSLCLCCKFDVEETLDKSIHKFEQRFHELKRLTHESGQESLQGQSVEVLMEFWKKAKGALNKSS